MSAIRIVGHRRTGTNYITQLFRRNLLCDVIMEGAHEMPVEEKTIPVYLVIRNPYDLMSSLYDWAQRHWFDKPPYNTLIKRRGDFSLDDFIMAPFAMGDRVQRRESPVEYYVRFVLTWQRFTPLIVRYEDAVMQPKLIVESVRADKKETFEYVKECVSPRGCRQPKFGLFEAKKEMKGKTVRFIDKKVELIKHLWPEIYA